MTEFFSFKDVIYLILFFIFKRFCLFIGERESERARETGKGQWEREYSPGPVRSLTWASIPGPWGEDLSRSPELAPKLSPWHPLKGFLKLLHNLLCHSKVNVWHLRERSECPRALTGTCMCPWEGGCPRVSSTLLPTRRKTLSSSFMEP